MRGQTLSTIGTGVRFAMARVARIVESCYGLSPSGPINLFNTDCPEGKDGFACRCHQNIKKPRKYKMNNGIKAQNSAPHGSGGWAERKNPCRKV